MATLSVHFNGHFSRWIWVSRDFIEAKDDGDGGDCWSYKTCYKTVKSSTSTNQHSAFYRPDAPPAAQPTVEKLLDLLAKIKVL